MTLPNFLILGAAKAGTTALYSYMQQHPAIFMSPVKETNFFALEGQPLDFCGPGDPINKWSITDLADYERMFDDVGTATAVGEASPLYLYSPRAPERIRHYVPDAKLIAILRDPVDRAYASFLFMQRELREPLDDFAAALAAEPERKAAKWEHTWYYRELGFYAQQLQRYVDCFPAEQIKVVFYQDFRADATAVLADIFRFLNVDDQFVPDMRLQPNKSGVPQNRTLQRLLKGRNPVKMAVKPFIPQRLRRQWQNDLRNRNLVKPQLDPAVRRDLIAQFRPDIEALQTLTGRDLSAWLE